MRWIDLGKRDRRIIRAATAAAAIAAAIPGARANETDQFLLPTDRPLAEVGPLISHAHYLVLEDFVERANERVSRARRIKESYARERALRAIHSPRTVANHVRAAFGPGFFETLELENALRSHDARSLYAGVHAAYKTSGWIYSSVHLPIDPRKIPLSLPSSTMRVFGHYVGSDKFGHFHDLGHLYHQDYRNLCNSGVDPAEALRRVVAFYARGPISEAGAIGFFATGVFSNADLAANYLGFKFYLNLTEPIMLDGVEHPPMLVRIGDYWALNHHVRAGSDFFRVFVSDHWNEALNPCVYEWGAAGPIARILRDHADQILTVYADESGNKRSREWFVEKARSLITCYGENYGHSGLEKATVTIASCCFGETEPEKAEPPGGTEGAATAPAAYAGSAAMQRAASAAQ